MKHIFFLLTLLLIFACVEDPADPNNPNNNMPVIINTTDNYTFTIHAEDYSNTNSDQLIFSSDTLEVYITLGNYSDGNGNISITSDSIEIFVDTLNANKTLIRTGIIVDVPSTVNMDFVDFSGDLSIILKAGGN